MIALLVVLPALAGSVDAEPTALWAGRQVTSGVREVPVLGEITTTTTIYTLARVFETEATLLLVDRPCRIEVVSDRGVQLEFDPTSVQRMPPATTRFERTEGGWDASAWPAGPGSDDLDRDGVAGMSVRVRAPICGGSLAVGTRTESRARGTSSAGGLTGEVDVRVVRDVYAASNPCLGLVTRHQEEEVAGVFVFVPVPADTTCETMDAVGWPEVPAPE